MGIDDSQKSSSWLRHAIMNFVHSGGREERASNHTTFVVDQMGQAIVAGDYPAGTMIPLDPDMCEMFGVSRTVVREAKKTLIAKATCGHEGHDGAANPAGVLRLAVVSQINPFWIRMNANSSAPMTILVHQLDSDPSNTM